MGILYDRVHRELTAEDIARIAETYHAWRGDSGSVKYEDVPGFCKSAKVEEIRKNGYVLAPGRYVGAQAQEEDGEPFEDKMQRLTAELVEQFQESTRLEAEIRANLLGLGYEI
jgi:type I restriction enzyme M protein